jgi:hypothetical protein
LKEKGQSVREYARKKRRQITLATQEIGRPDYWTDVDYESVERGRGDFKFFCEHYFKHLFFLPWADCHLEAISRLERSALEGKNAAIALPRGYGKTTLCRVATIWVALYGHHQFTFLMGANKENSQDNLDAIKKQLLNRQNDPLQTDFWPVMWPILCAGGEPRACKGQKYEGEPTGLEWAKNQLKLPHNPKNDGASSIIRVTGILGSFLGANETDHEGRQVRPSFIVVDDPQTPQSARSASQTGQRMRVITSSIRGMKDVTQSISIVIPCTVISPGDLTDQLTNRDNYPEFNGLRTSMVESFPKSKKWNHYAKLYKQQVKEDSRVATEYYLENREDMDAGAKVSWEHGYDPDKAESTLEYAMQYKFTNPEFFWAECQNDPLPENDDSSAIEMIDADGVTEKINNRPRYEVAEKCEIVTAYADVHDNLIYWAVCAFTDNWDAYIIDYDTFPRQSQGYFTLRNVPRGLGDIYKNDTVESRIYQGLASAVSVVCDREYRRADGEPMYIDQMGVDQRYKTDTVHKVCYEHQHRDKLLPAFGQGIAARNVPIKEYNRKQGDKIGDHWVLKRRLPGRPKRALLIDVNYWKTWVTERLQLKASAEGSMTLFGESPIQHRLFAEHLTAEYCVRTEGRGRVVHEWSLPNGGPDNHWFDCVVGCAALASYCGVGSGSNDSRSDGKARMSMSEMRRNARG